MRCFSLIHVNLGVGVYVCVSGNVRINHYYRRRRRRRRRRKRRKKRKRRIKREVKVEKNVSSHCFNVTELTERERERERESSNW